MGYERSGTHRHRAISGGIRNEPTRLPAAISSLYGKSWGDVYQLGMSMVDSAAVAALSPVLGTAGTALLGGSAATQGMLDAVANGANDEQALAMGFLNGAFEMLFEKVSLESLLSRDTANVIEAMLRQGLSEGSEETFTSIANNVADILIMAEKSGYMKNVQQYRDQGLDEKDAVKQAILDMGIDVGWDFVGGMFTGGIMGGSDTVRKNAINKLTVGAEKYTTAEDGVKYNIRRTQNMPWDQQIDSFLSKGKGIVRSDTLVLDNTPAMLVSDGVESKTLAIPLSVITKAKNGKDASHSVTDENLKDLQRGVRNSPIVINNPARNALVFITDIKQDGTPVLVAFQKNATFDGDDVHKATSIHLQMDVGSMLKALPSNATVYAKNENELNAAVGVADSLRSLSANVKFTRDMVAQSMPGVNGENASTVAELAIGVLGIGLYETNADGHFVHVDTRTTKSFWYGQAGYKRYTFGGAPKQTTTTTKGDYTMEMRNLKKGMTGQDVRALQILLNGRGQSCGNADGSFGTKTDAAVKNYQKAKGLTQDGIVGKKTMSALLGVS